MGNGFTIACCIIAVVMPPIGYLVGFLRGIESERRKYRQQEDWLDAVVKRIQTRTAQDGL
jgi:hypothetical protein